MVSPPIPQNSGTDGDQDESNFQFIVLAKNARINTHERVVQVLAELENVEWDVVLLNETRAAKSKFILDGGHALFSNISDNRCA